MEKMAEYERERIYELALENNTIAEISRQTGRSRPAIRNFLIEKGICSVGGKGGHVSKSIPKEELENVNAGIPSYKEADKKEVKMKEPLLITAESIMQLVSAKTGTTYLINSTSDKIEITMNEGRNYVFDINELADFIQELNEVYETKKKMTRF